MVQLHDRYRRVFDSMRQGPEVFEDIAESYGAMNSIRVRSKSMSGSWQEPEKKRGTYLKCALYSLRMGDKGKSSQFCKQIQAEALDVRKSEVLGHLSFREQKYGDAVKYFGKILHKQKEFDLCEPDSFRIYGQTLYELKKYDEAIPILQKGFERIKSDDPTTSAPSWYCLENATSNSSSREGGRTIEMAMRFAGEEQLTSFL